MQKLPFPTNILPTTITPPTAIAITVFANTAKPKNSHDHKMSKITSLVGCKYSFAHIVTYWTDTKFNNCMSVAIILLFRINPSKIAEMVFGLLSR